jgi:tetratricopeptide (TPR) repeat protein
MNPILRSVAFATALAGVAASAFAGAVEDVVSELQTEWATISYRSPAAQRDALFEKLAARAHEASTAHPARAEPLVWEGIIVSSWAGARGGLGGLSLAKQAKALYERALQIRPDALEGSAFNSLGVLYYKVPSWPIGFGDKGRAQELLGKALELNPRGIDPNYFYGEYLLEAGKAAEAIPYLERAIGAPPRPGRELADAGRREEARQLMQKARAQAR